MTAQTAEPRYVPPGSCSWCGHPPHDVACPKTIRRSKDDPTAPCPCSRHTWKAAR